MTVKTDKLVRMAEQISANMAYTDDDHIVATRIADHLAIRYLSYWYGISWKTAAGNCNS